MAYSIVYRQPLERCFRASASSLAALVAAVVLVAKILLPLLIVFATKGLWLKTSSFREQPRVSFEGRFLVLLDARDEFLFASSFAVLNALDHRHLSIANVRSYEVDEDGDGKPERISITVEIPKGTNFTVSSITYFFFVDYKLDYNSDVHVETAISETAFPPFESGGLQVAGALFASQLEPFFGQIRSSDVFDEGNVQAHHFSIPAIQERIRQQVINTELTRKSSRFTPSTSPSFSVSVDFSIPTQDFSYRTDLFQLLKWAWIQYFAIFYIVHYFLQHLLDYLYSNGVLEGIPSSVSISILDRK